MLRSYLLVVTLGLLCLPAVASHSDESWCSPVSFAAGLPSPDRPHFIGRPTPDSLVAGPGPVRLHARSSSSSSPDSLTIRGQVVEVERMGTLELGAPFDRVDWDRRVLVVPWGYDTACQPVPWSGPAAWREPGGRAFYWVRLRPAEQWSAGLPTFDAFMPATTVFPPPSDRRRIWEYMGVDELFALVEELPDAAEIATDPTGAATRFSRYIDGVTGLRDLFPAPVLESRVRSLADVARARRLQPAWLGTYRLVVRLPSDTTLVTYMRTASRPAGPWYPVLTSGRTPSEASEVGNGYWVWMVYGPREQLPDTLGMDSAIGSRSTWQLGVMSAPDDPATERLQIEVPELGRMFPDAPPELFELLERWRDSFRERWRAGRIDPAPGRIITAGGEVRLIFPVDADGDGEADIILTGRRIGSETARPHLPQR